MPAKWLPLDDDDPRVAVIFDDVLPEKGWEVWVFLDNEHGKPIVHEIRVAPQRTGTDYRKAPPGGFKSSFRDKLNVDQLRRRAFQELSEHFPDLRDDDNWSKHAAASETIQAAKRGFHDPQFAGRRRRTPSLYARVAASYYDHAGRSRRVYEAMRASDFPNYHEETLRDLVKECRRQGYLTESPKGRAGGELTEKTSRILAKLKEEEDGER